MGNRTYSPEFKLQVALEALQSDGTDAEVARAYDIHPVELEKETQGKRIEGLRRLGRAEGEERQDREARTQRPDQKEVEIALLKNFLGES